MKKGQKPPMVYLTQSEYGVIQMGLGRILDDMAMVTEDPTIPFTPETRADMSKIVIAARSAAQKIKNVTGVDAALPPYQTGDENEFLTKES